MVAPVLFKMTQGYITYCPWVIYFVPVLFKWHRAIFHIVPGLYMFVPRPFKMTLGYYGSLSVWLFPMCWVLLQHHSNTYIMWHLIYWSINPPDFCVERFKRTGVWKWFTCEFDKAIRMIKDLIFELNVFSTHAQWYIFRSKIEET